MEWIWLTPLFLVISICHSDENFRPCPEVFRELKFPCLCALGLTETTLNGNPSISINCDNVVFSGDVPSLPYWAPIVSFSQRSAGDQVLPAQIFSSTDLPLRRIDLSGNLLRRLGDKLLQRYQSTLVELRLADNLLGDTLNPIFSSSEFHGLTHLQILDLSGNSIKAIEEGIMEGCKNLQQLFLDKNSFIYVPSSSLNGPKSLKVLSLKDNRIGIIKDSDFQSQPNLEEINLSNNRISTIEGEAFTGLDKLRNLRISQNKLSTFNSDVFEGAGNLEVLDLSENFIVEFPTIALKDLSALSSLNLSSNLIQSLDNKDLISLVNLRSLDLSRNNIANIVPGTFLGLKLLKKLDISVNSLRTIEDDAFEGLDNLEHLNLKDNNILLIPASALGRLPKLTSLQLDYNRVAAISGDILRSIAERVTTLVLSKNVVRELPSYSFQYFQHLQYLDLTRNAITTLNTDAFFGLENSLTNLYLSQNHITTLIGSVPLVLKKLKILDLSENYLSELSRSSFIVAPSLKHLNLSRNIHLSTVPPSLIKKLNNLQSLDVSYTGMKTLRPDLFTESTKMRVLHLHNNFIVEIFERTFANMPNLTVVDLSYNNINNIHQGAFVHVLNIKKLSLKGNKLTSFKGEIFNTGTSLEILDISDNELSYLFPSSFRIHPRLKRIDAARNKFNFFSAELITSLQFLEHLDVSGNSLKVVQELDFAKLPRLRTILLANNHLEAVSEMAFHNSTQLQVIDLSYNKLERLNERTFEGLVRLQLLNLEGNRLSDLPETIFERAKLQVLENINLARNLFEIAPLKSLQRQYFFVSSVDLSHNKLKEIPADDSIMVNIKNLDLSFNDLSEKTIKNILGEPKTIRELNLAGTGITELPQLETPFLRYLNLSHNNISSLSERVFERSTLLEVLDISYNNISNISNFSKIWPTLKNMQTLNISNNPIQIISQNDFVGLEFLRHLSLHSLKQCERIEKGAFKSVANLFTLDIYDYPKLGYIDVQGLLQNVPCLERINIESKDSVIGGNQLQSVLHPRLKELGLMGPRLRSISSGALSGIKGPEVVIKLINTSLTSLPPAIFFPVPRSSKVTLDVSGSLLSTLSLQILTTIDDRRGKLEIRGLESNPIICNCNARALRRWLPAHMTSVKCSGPNHFAGKLLVEIGDDELVCESTKNVTTSSSTIVTTQRTTQTTPRLRSKTVEPEIIWSVPMTEKPVTKAPATGQSVLNNDDTLIIGIVGGVVAFIAILIIIICIIRLRMTGNQYGRGGAMVAPAMMGAGPGSTCACSVKGVPPVYPGTPYGIPYGPAYATLPHKDGLRIAVSETSLTRQPYYQNSGQPYFIAFPSDEKIYQ